VETRFTGFHLDEAGDWVAELACGHTQHVRHKPPWQVRPWVTTSEGRASRIGQSIDCPLCDAGAKPGPNAAGDAEAARAGR
jgi:hypothetical protein